MATATRPVSPNAAYPAEAVSRLFAPPEAEVPALKLRRLLHEARDRFRAIDEGENARPATRAPSSTPPAPTTPSPRPS